MERTNGQIRESFDRLVRLLDAAIESARPALESASISIRDASNRSCFDMSGWPYCVYDMHFERRYAHGSETALAAAELYFREPYDSSERTVIARSIAEVFQTGSLSRIREAVDHPIAADRIAEIDLETLVGQLLDEARRALTHHGVRPRA